MSMSVSILPPTTVIQIHFVRTMKEAIPVPAMKDLPGLALNVKVCSILLFLVNFNI